MPNVRVHSQSMGLPRRLAALTALLAILLVLGATEIALSWSARTRLEDFRLESVALAGTLASLLLRTAPTGNPTALAQGLEGWSKNRITESQAVVYVNHGGRLTVAASSDPAALLPAEAATYTALREDRVVVQLRQGDDPAWQVLFPLGAPRPFGVLDVQVSTQRLQDWARLERRRAYFLAGLSAVLVALGVAVLTAQWVGRPLSELGGAMAAAHGGAGGAPAAPELGPPEFRALARRYNDMREALAAREQESAARAMLLTLEERARSFDRLALMQETAASFAHEIGTPLNTMSGHLQLLRDDLEADRHRSGADRARLLLGQVDRVAGIVRAALERGTWPTPMIEQADLTEIARQMLRFLEPSFNDAGVTAVLVPSDGRGELDHVTATCDPAMVEQILLNLLKNAIEAVPPGAQIEVSAGQHGVTAYIEVRDNGPGLTPAAEAQLFKPFATTKDRFGTGLGLAVSRRLARLLGGDLIHLPSPRGTWWRLIVPLAKTEER